MTTDTEARRKPHGCNSCDRRWTGSAMCHCGACHETFGGLASFDKHRSGTKPGAKDKQRQQGECSAPAEIGLVLNAHGTWVAPSDGADFGAIFGKDGAA